MVKLVEIGGIIKKGLGQKVVQKFSQDKNVVSVGFANGRAKDLFDIQQFGDASEAEVLTLIVKEKTDNRFVVLVVVSSIHNSHPTYFVAIE